MAAGNLGGLVSPLFEVKSQSLRDEARLTLHPEGISLMESQKVLIIEDDPIVLETVTICFYVCRPEAEVLTAQTGEEGIELVRSQSPDLIILDLGLPGIDGYQTLKQLRAFSETPVILLTARDGEMARIKGLELGADDYITKPFSHIVLMARVKAVLRRAPAQSSDAPKGVYRNEEAALEIDKDTRTVTRQGRLVSLAPLEYSILDLLVSNEGHIVTRKMMLSKIWGPGYLEEIHYLKVYIRRLRNKLGDDPQHTELIHTERGIGYIFKARPGVSDLPVA